jgi:hypothetical protein
MLILGVEADFLYCRGRVFNSLCYICVNSEHQLNKLSFGFSLEQQLDKLTFPQILELSSTDRVYFPKI